MKRFLINLALAIAAFTVQSCIFPQIPFLSASPNLLGESGAESAPESSGEAGQ